MFAVSLVANSTDRQGGYVKTDPVSPADLAATILYHLGIDRARRYHAPLLDERYPLVTGAPIRNLE